MGPSPRQRREANWRAAARVDLAKPWGCTGAPAQQAVSSAAARLLIGQQIGFAAHRSKPAPLAPARGQRGHFGIDVKP